MLEGIKPPQKEAVCYLMRKAASDLDSADLAILNEALADPRWSSNALGTALNDRGFKINKGAINEHRTKKCACARVS